MRKKHILGELFSFVRIETCFFITGISVAGYMMFNRVDISLIFLFLAIFLGTGGSYAWNYLTDRREDFVNNKQLNYFVLRAPLGKKVVAFLFLSGFVFSFFLSLTFFVLYSLLMFLGVAYSGLRIKGIFIAKNVFTGFTIALTFLAGSVVSAGLSLEILSYLPFIFMFGLMLNLLGDIRGCEGDKLARVKTIPLVAGENFAKYTVYSIAGVFTFSVLIFGYFMLYPLIPFMLLICFFLYMDDHRKSRISILASFMFLSAFLFFINIAGGG